jgi:hypothetical protein
MEPEEVESSSALAHNSPIAHRFIRSDPHGGNYLLSQIVGYSGSFLSYCPTREEHKQHPLRGLSNMLNEVTGQISKLEPLEGCS